MLRAGSSCPTAWGFLAGPRTAMPSAMKSCPLAALALVLLGSFAAWADSPENSHDASFSKEGLIKANVADLKDTQLVAHPDVALAPTQNVLWCGTLQLAWNEAIKLVGEKLHFTSASPEADRLNREDFTRADLDPGSYVAVADFEKNHVEDEIRAALEETFHGSASPELIPAAPRTPGPDDFIAYAYLYKNLAFAHPFADNQHLHFGDQPVESFGFNQESHLPPGTLAQVKVYDYQSRDNFIVELKTKSVADELILAKIPPGVTLQATIKTVLDRMAQHSPALVGPGDAMAVPKLNFDLRRDFTELEGLTLQPTPAARIKDKLVMAKVEQLVRFQLNEKGAVLKSEAVVNMVGSAIMPGRMMIFDQPFLILMKQTQSSQPYFALWVGNASLLIPLAKPPAP
jgi:hypothetical protein